MLEEGASDPDFFIVMPDGTKIPGPLRSGNEQKDKD